MAVALWPARSSASLDPQIPPLPKNWQRWPQGHSDEFHKRRTDGIALLWLAEQALRSSQRGARTFPQTHDLGDTAFTAFSTFWPADSQDLRCSDSIQPTVLGVGGPEAGKGGEGGGGDALMVGFSIP